MDKPVFSALDLADTLPPPGSYSCTVASAGYRASQRGNRMLVVVYALDGVEPPHDRVADYFVLEGASERGCNTARRRLVRLYRCCAVEPVAGSPIDPAALREARLQVRIEHEPYDGELRLKVASYRPAHAPLYS